MLRVSTRARRGNFAYAQKPFKAPSTGPVDGSIAYQVACPSCKREVGKHCIALKGPDKGFWIQPHRTRYRLQETEAGLTSVT